MDKDREIMSASVEKLENILKHYADYGALSVIPEEQGNICVVLYSNVCA